MYRVGGFEVDLSSLELRDPEGSRVEISPLAFDLLLYLIEHRDRVVPKDELFDTLWGDVAVSPSSLSQGIWTVRRALRDTGGAQRVIKNVRGRGYRLVADVEVAGPPSSRSGSRLKAATPPEAAVDGGLVGRREELARLRRALEETCAGEGGRTLLVSGWAGMGKTRLAAELSAIGESLGATVCQARCFDDETMPPFWAWQQIARGLLRRHPPEQLAALVGDGAGDLVKLIPELHEGIPDLAGAPQRGLGLERFQLFDALRALLEHAAAQRPLLLVIDDLHWADEPTLRCLEFLAAALQPMRVLLLCTLRAGTANAALEATVSNVLRHPGAALLELSGLAEPEVAALLRQHGLADAAPSLIRRVLDLTSGNPFFVTQLARWLASHPVAASGPADQLKLPAEARAVLRKQLSALPAPTLELLQLAAVLGQAFHISDLRRASRLCASDVIERLDPALERRIVREDDHDVGTFRFGHPTFRETLYEDLPRAQRVRLHRAAADGIAQGHGDDPTSRLNELAHHYYEAAAGGGSAAEASRYCRLSAERAHDATAFEEAVMQYRRALHALGLQDPIDERERCRVLLGLGRAMRGTPVAVEEIRKVFAEAAELAKHVGDARLLAEAAMCHAGRGPMRLGVLREIGTVHGGEIELLDQARAAIGTADSPERARVEVWLAHSLYNSERRSERKTLANSAVQVARRLGDPHVLAECLMIQQAAVREPVDIDARIDAMSEVIELTRKHGPLGLQLDAYCERAWACWELCRLAEAEADMLNVQRLAEETRQPREKRVAAHWRVMLLDADARFDEADALLREIDAALPPPQQGRLDQGRAIRRFMIAGLLGRAAESLPGLEAFAAQFPLPVAWHCGLVTTYASAGRLSDAARELGRLAVGDFAVIPDDHNWITSHALLCTACRLLDDAEHATVLYRKLEPFGDRMAVVGLYGFCAGVVHRCLAEFATVFGDFERAERHFVRSVEDNARLGAHVWTAWSRIQYARMLLLRAGRGDQGLAFEQISKAVSYARARGLDEFVTAAEAVREEAGRRPVRGSAG
jgi:DNA-binding winged helix-turn-helix (wHTH) protein